MVMQAVGVLEPVSSEDFAILFQEKRLRKGNGRNRKRGEKKGRKREKRKEERKEERLILVGVDAAKVNEEGKVVEWIFFTNNGRTIRALFDREGFLIFKNLFPGDCCISLGEKEKESFSEEVLLKYLEKVFEDWQIGKGVREKLDGKRNL